MPRSRALLAVVAFALLAAACSSGGEGGPSGSTATTGSSDLTAVIASSDLYVGEPQRVALGLVLPDGRLVSFGSVDVAFSFVGDEGGSVTPRPGPSAEARFVPTYGTPDRPGGPVLTSPDEGRGVYEATGVAFDRAGYWSAEVTADVEGLGRQTAETTFAVAEEPGLLAPGDEAYRTDSLTLDSKGVPEAAIDSRAAEGGHVPDPELHRWSIAEAIARRRPALVVFATPVYCTSRFCGPVTDMVQDLAHRFRDRAVFIHVEIWQDFREQVLNDAALEWLQLPSGDLTEPWLFLVGAGGRIADRWSTLWSQDEVDAALRALPANP